MLTIARGTTYSFRRKVPAQARAAIGRGELWITLRTGDRRKAESVASLLRWLTDDLFERAGMADEDKDEIETLRREVAELQHVARFDGERRRVEELLRRKAVQRPLWRIATPVSWGRPPHHCGRGQVAGGPHPARGKKKFPTKGREFLKRF